MALIHNILHWVPGELLVLESELKYLYLTVIIASDSDDELEGICGRYVLTRLTLWFD